MFKRKKKDNLKAELSTNMSELIKLVREAESLLDQLQNEVNFYKKHHRKLKSLTTKTNNKFKEIENFKFKTKIKSLKKSDE